MNNLNCDEGLCDNESRLSVKEWSQADRPREKLIQMGVASLSDAELIAILLRSGTKEESAVELSRRILSECKNNLNELAGLKVNDLIRRFKGVGVAKSASIVAALELGKRKRASAILEKKQIMNSRDIFELFNSKLSNLDYEECWIILMNNQHRIKAIKKISQGGTSETTVDIKIVMKFAIDCLATAIAMCHNHPAGNPRPSKADDKLTEKLKSVCGNLDIQFVDHLIFSEGNYYSYADRGHLL